MNSSAVKPALDGIIIVSVGHTLPGLYCLAMLRDLGARIIRIERLSQASGHEKTVNERYKGMDVTFPIRSLTTGTEVLSLDLKQEKGIEVFKKITARADVVLEGFRPGVMQRLGIDYASLSKNKPELIYAAITGYGQSGAYKEKVGHDINYLAETGVLALTNPVVLPGATYADGMAGISAALNIVAAIHGRTQSGKGQMIDCAIVDGPLSLMTSEFEHYWNTGESRTTGANHLTGSHPWYGVYSTKDAKQVVIGAVEPMFYQTFCHGLGLPELAHAQFAEGKSLDEARKKIADAIAAKTRDEIIHLFESHNACVSPVSNTRDVIESSLSERGFSTDRKTGEKTVRTPVRLPYVENASTKSVKDILSSLRFPDDEIEQLRQLGVLSSAH